MAKLNLKAKWESCPDCIVLFGMPVCSYGVIQNENISLKDFYPCMKNGICRKEKLENNKR